MFGSDRPVFLSMACGVRSRGDLRRGAMVRTARGRIKGCRSRPRDAGSLAAGTPRVQKFERLPKERRSPFYAFTNLRGEHFESFASKTHVGTLRLDRPCRGDRHVTPVCHTPPLISSAARPPIMYEAALVPGPEIMDGMTEASATRSPRNPWTRSLLSTTASASAPIFAVPTA
jgi:hypothetical protein